MKRTGCLLLVFIISLFTACGGGGGKGGKDNPGNVIGKGIYVAGDYVDESKTGDAQNVSCIWKITDSDTSKIELTNDSCPESVYVYNDKVYVSGRYWDSSSETNITCCWIISSEGTVTKYDLPGGWDAPSVYVYNDTAYIAGYYETTSGGSIKYVACYWTIDSSGTVSRTDLADGFDSNNVEAKSIFVNEDAVYVAGNFYNASVSKNVACCWVLAEDKATGSSNTPSYLLDGQDATGIVVKDGTIYISGEVITATPSFMGVYWVIPPESEESYTVRYDHEEGINSYADTISVGNDGTVYTAGRRNGWYPCFWTGTDRTDLGTNEGKVSSMAISDGTLYMAGNYKEVYGSGQVEVACYWKGTTRIDLTDITDDNISNGDAAAIFVYE